jgi:glycosyltransferase involved in cell wall biosynthesis
MIRVGIVLMPDENWLGGINYYRNLMHAVNSMPDKQIEFVAITSTETDINQLIKDYPCSEVIKSKLFNRFSFKWLVRKLITKLIKRDYLFSALLIKHKVDVLSHSGWLGKNSKIPTLGWIPDFQHVHLPDFFTKTELKVRDQTFLDICNLCTSVIVSSYDALNDLKQFSPKTINKTVVMQFAVKPKKENIQVESIEELKLRYRFNTPFFLLPNQFWAHKNHRVVIDALEILKKQNISVTVLATGNTNDYRQPNFFSNLQKLINDKNVENEFKVLGMIPESDLYSLFIYANAVINPSFFEGWSTTVEEAKVIRKKIILSDIAIHKEQDPELGLYFNPNDSRKLAALLIEHATIDESINKEIKEKDIAEFINYGQSYQSIVKQVLDSN